MNYYKHSPTCFSAYCAIFKENFLVCSKLLLHHLMTELKLYYNIQIIYNIYYITYYFLIYLLTPSSTVLLEKLTGPQLANKFPTFYGTRRFITALTSALHLSISWVSSMQSIPPHPTSWRSILISSSHLCLGFPSGLFPLSLPTKSLYMPSLSHSSRCITQTILGEEYRTLRSSLYNIYTLYNIYIKFIILIILYHIIYIILLCCVVLCYGILYYIIL